MKIKKKRSPESRAQQALQKLKLAAQKHPMTFVEEKSVDAVTLDNVVYDYIGKHLLPSLPIYYSLLQVQIAHEYTRRGYVLAQKDFILPRCPHYSKGTEGWCDDVVVAKKDS